MSHINTVKIKANNAAGYVIVNEADAQNEDVIAKWQNGLSKVDLVITDDDGSTPEDPRPDGSYGTPKDGENAAETGTETSANPLSKSALKNMSHADLVVLATEKGHDVVPDDETKASLIAKILGE